MTETLHFACTECGKCCSEAPEMSLLEALSLGDVFIPSVAYKLTRLPKEDNEAGYATLKLHPDFEEMSPRDFVKALRESVAVKAGIEVTGEPGWDAFVFITSRPWHYQRASCPALDADGKRCTVHARRPSTCRTVPVRYDVPEALLVRAFHGTVTRGKAAKDAFLCDTTNKAPAFIKDGKLVDAAYAEDRESAVQRAIAEKELASRLIVSPYLPPAREVIERLRKHGPFSVSFHAAVLHAKELGKIEDAAARAFCEKQIARIDAEVDKAISRKRPDEREWTTRFRGLADAYRSALRALSS